MVLPVAATGSCQILDLVLGPLDLNLLGLLVHLDTVHLNITAQQGPGNLLGNLLCAVAGLLDNPATPAGGLAGLLNRILGILGYPPTSPEATEPRGRRRNPGFGTTQLCSNRVRGGLIMVEHNARIALLRALAAEIRARPSNATMCSGKSEAAS